MWDGKWNCQRQLCLLEKYFKACWGKERKLNYCLGTTRHVLQGIYNFDESRKFKKRLKEIFKKFCRKNWTLDEIKVLIILNEKGIVKEHVTKKIKDEGQTLILHKYIDEVSLFCVTTFMNKLLEFSIKLFNSPKVLNFLSIFWENVFNDWS